MLEAPSRESPCLALLTTIIAASFEQGRVPSVCKRGNITMVPKTKPDGTFRCSAADMRPITLLPEMGKIASRVLANRLNLIFLCRPDLLDRAQRGCLKDGAVGQCTDVLLDVIEDWHQRREGGGKWPLYVVSYDQSKAFDSIQFYAIRASLERFNMPDSFIAYTLSGLRGSTSAVQTAGGLTEAFTVQSGVRQGDPLSPIIYMLNFHGCVACWST